MNTFDNNKTNETPDAQDFLGGNYLKKEDLDGQTVVTISEVWTEVVLGTSRRKLVVSFQEIDKPLILNKTNIRRLSQAFQTTNTAAWRGQVTLYVESNVEYRGELVGGLRVGPANMSNGQAHTNGERQEEVAGF